MATGLTVPVYTDRALDRKTRTHNGAFHLTQKLDFRAGNGVSFDDVIQKSTTDTSADGIGIVSQYLVITAQDVKEHICR